MFCALCSLGGLIERHSMILLYVAGSAGFPRGYGPTHAAPPVPPAPPGTSPAADDPSASAPRSATYRRDGIFYFAGRPFGRDDAFTQREGTRCSWENPFVLLHPPHPRRTACVDPSEQFGTPPPCGAAKFQRSRAKQAAGVHPQHRPPMQSEHRGHRAHVDKLRNNWHAVSHRRLPFPDAMPIIGDALSCNPTLGRTGDHG